MLVFCFGICGVFYDWIVAEGLNLKYPFQAEFGEIFDASYLKFQFYQLICIYDTFSNFLIRRWHSGWCLGANEGSSDELTFKVDISVDAKKKINHS